MSRPPRWLTWVVVVVALMVVVAVLLVIAVARLGVPTGLLGDVSVGSTS